MGYQQSDSLIDRLEFFVATDSLKSTFRANWIRGEQRFESVAEHVWHATLLAMVFADAAPEGTDHNKVRDLLTVHDLVEVYAGDVPIWDQHSASDIELSEQEAGERLMALLPSVARDRLDPLWREFQAQQTTEARFARAIDALHPMVMSWFPPPVGHQRRAEITPARVLARKGPDIEPFPALWEVAQWLVLQAVDAGFIPADKVSNRIAAEGMRHGER